MLASRIAARTLSAPWPARGAQLAGDRARGLGDRRGDAARRAARQDRLRVADDADRADGVSRVVEDGRGDARLAQHGLVALARQAGFADVLELAAQRRGGRRAARQLWQR